MLNSQDALLGPWLPGRDMLEDELRTFVGKQHSPWTWVLTKWKDCLLSKPAAYSGGLCAFNSCRHLYQTTVSRHVQHRVLR